MRWRGKVLAQLVCKMMGKISVRVVCRRASSNNKYKKRSTVREGTVEIGGKKVK